MVKLKKIRKASKKAKKSVKKASAQATQDVAQTTHQTVKTVAKETSHATKYAGKKFNYVTGEIEEAVDKALDYTLDDLKTAVKYAEKKWKAGADWVEDLAKDAIEEAYRAVYKECVGDYVKFVEELTEVQRSLLSKNTNLLTDIRDNLLIGKFSKSMDGVAELVESSAMRKSLDAGHKLFGTSFIIAADLSAGASTHGVTGGAGGAIGIVSMLDHFEDYKHRACIFTALGGAVGASTSQGIGGELGLSMGFLAKDPTNIGGWFVDVSGQGEMASSFYGLGLSWSPPGKKPPYVKPVPVAGVTRVGFSQSLSPDSAGPSGSVTIGGSYTWIIQKIKNNLYQG